MLTLDNNFDTPFIFNLSFENLIDKIEQAIEKSGSHSCFGTDGLIEKVKMHEHLRTGIAEAEISDKTTEVLRSLLEVYFPKDLSGNEIKAVCIPFMSSIFNLTDRFRKILEDAGEEFQFNIRDFDEHQFYVLSCCLILNVVYGTRLDFSKPIFYDIPTSEGIMKHYRILYNADFITLSPTSHAYTLTKEDIIALRDNYNDLNLWKKIFPPQSWKLQGFAIMTLFDATMESALSIFKEKMIDFNDPDLNQSLNSVFRSIFYISGINVGLTFFNLSGQIQSTFSLSNLKSHFQDGWYKSLGRSFMAGLTADSGYFALSDVAAYCKKNGKDVIAKRLKKQGVNSVIIAPVIKNKKILGLLEVSSSKIGELNSINSHKLDIVVPYLADKAEVYLTSLENEIQALIQVKYTSVHPSVNWKFRIEAERAINSSDDLKKNHQQEIKFENVYPLYGQTDIKGSSNLRNTCVAKDLQVQLAALGILLNELTLTSANSEFLADYLQVKEFLRNFPIQIPLDREQFIIRYLEEKVHRRLKKVHNPCFHWLIEQYFKNEDPQVGAFHRHRRKYEQMLQRINSTFTTILDKEQVIAQAVFPHYYDRFKTDGVEHNLYVGRSIFPEGKFNRKVLGQLRFWQLRVMCSMEIAYHLLKARLPYKVNVTSLILVFDTPIAIHFRMDEKRFDVAGSYDVRFEMMKKRIDKAYIKNTQYRITQEGKIVIVYSNDSDAKEYLLFIKRLQKQGILSQIEYFEIQELQGVSGLKGIRVALVY